MDWKTLLFTFDGRINRAKFWLGVLFIVLLNIATVIVFAILSAAAGENSGLYIGGFVAFIPFVIATIMTFAIVIKRLHDREKSGWWSLVFIVLLNVLSVAGAALGGIGAVLSLASLAILIWALVELGCLKGTTGPNTYGPDLLPAEPD
jgi:uncharacterized membrane protein YhaH (DUF805 family)